MTLPVLFSFSFFPSPIWGRCNLFFYYLIEKVITYFLLCVRDCLVCLDSNSKWGLISK